MSVEEQTNSASVVSERVTIPIAASFQKSGRTVVYVLSGSKFEEREVKEDRRSGHRILVANGLRSGERVALKDPSSKE